MTSQILFENTVYRISAPKGGLTHHLRWLCFLSEKFLDLTSLNSVSFFNKERFPFKSVDRVQYIESYIYNAGKVFSNWINTEYQIKNSLNSIFYSVHSTKELIEHPNKKIYTLLINVDADLACKHYYKFHPFLAGSLWKKKTLNEFIEDVLECCEQNNTYIPKTNESVIKLDADILYNNILDKEFYNSIVEFLNIDNQYDHANYVHNLWFNLNCKAEKDMLNFVENEKYPACPWYNNNYKFNDTKLYDENDWEDMRNIALKYYKEKV